MVGVKVFFPAKKFPPVVVQSKAKLAPVLDPVASKERLLVAQVSRAAGAMAAIGRMVSIVAVVVAVAVQPFVRLVTVKSYVPAAPTTGESVLVPLTTSGPAQANFAGSPPVSALALRAD